MEQSKSNPYIIKEKIRLRVNTATHCRHNDDGKKDNHCFHAVIFFRLKKK